MKNHSFILAVVAGLITLTSYVLKEKTTTYRVDPAQSTLTWTGKKVTGQHTGNVKLSDGSLVFEGTTVKSGSFDIDVASITVTDIADKTSNEKLVGHLKADDFFGTEKHPKATFVTTKVVTKGNNQYDVTGDLTIKGITHPVTFPATIKNESSKVTADAKITIDRTKYGIKFKSASFFENLGDKAIEDNFILDVHLIANKKTS